MSARLGPGAVDEKAVIEGGGEADGDAAVESGRDRVWVRGDEGFEERGEEGEGRDELGGEGAVEILASFRRGRIPATVRKKSKISRVQSTLKGGSTHRPR